MTGPDPLHVTTAPDHRSPRKLLSAEVVTRRVREGTRFAGRYLTADFRRQPDFVILGTQRGSTTSLYRWLSSHADVAPAMKKEIHYFDDHYRHGSRWYRAHFPLRGDGRTTGEASPYMLFHPLSPMRAARDLPAHTRFIVLLREPADRAISQYWFWRKLGLYERESLERAIELEPERMARAEPVVLRGLPSIEHMAFSYVSRGEYAPQLRRWFDAVGRERILVLESERLPEPSNSGTVLDWLGLAPHHEPFPTINAAERLDPDSDAVLSRLRTHFAPFNRELFDLLGRELWTGGDDHPHPAAT
jgi:hypothetical protein